MNSSSGAATTIRAATVHDLSALHEIAFRSKAHWGYDEAFMRSIEPSLGPGEDELAAGMFLAEQGGAPVGFYSFLTIDGDHFLHSLFVAPEKIGCGLGKLLWQHAVQSARRAGRDHFLIESDPNAENFYLHQGAHRIGEIVSTVSRRSLPLLRFGLTMEETTC